MQDLLLILSGSQAPYVKFSIDTLVKLGKYDPILELWKKLCYIQVLSCLKARF